MNGAYFLVMLVAIGWLAIWSVLDEPDENPGSHRQVSPRRYGRVRRARWSPFDMRETTMREPAPIPAADLPPWRRKR